MRSPKTLTRPHELVAAGLAAPERMAELDRVAARYAVAITPALAAGILARGNDNGLAPQFVPTPAELVGAANELSDPIGDSRFTPVKGIVHRHRDRVLLMPTQLCAVYCRFCFRRETVGGADAVLAPTELEAALAYIRSHAEIWEVILSGGDPLVLSPRRLAAIVTALDGIEHVAVIRVHTRVPVATPERVTAEIVSSLTSTKAVFVILHVNHPDELTEDAKKTCHAFVKAGIPLLSQTVLLRGVNDRPAVLETLLRRLVSWRIKPYYLHHPDMASGTAHFRTGLAEGQGLMRQLRRDLSGLCQPTYVLDVPGGFGKVPVGPCHVAPGPDPDSHIVEDLAGGVHIYPPPVPE